MKIVDFKCDCREKICKNNPYNAVKLELYCFVLSAFNNRDDIE